MPRQKKPVLGVAEAALHRSRARLVTKQKTLDRELARLQAAQAERDGLTHSIAEIDKALAALKS